MKLAPDAFEFTADDLEELTEQAEAKYTAALPDGGTEWDDLTDDERNPYINTEIFKEKVLRATAAVKSGGAFDTADRLISSALNQFGSSMAFVDNQIKYNSQKVDAMEGGLGALVDADLAKESSTLEALKVRQQLGVQTLGLANQGPQVLLGLFR